MRTVKKERHEKYAAEHHMSRYDNLQCVKKSLVNNCLLTVIVFLPRLMTRLGSLILAL